MKLDRDMMALLKATKKVAIAPRQTLERLRKSSEPRAKSPYAGGMGDIVHGSEGAS